MPSDSDKKLLILCRRLARRFVCQAAHLGAPEDVFDELVNVAYVAGREGRYILWYLLEYVTKPSDKVKRCAFRTGDARRIYRDEEKTPERIAEEEDDKEKAFDLIRMLEPDSLMIIVLYFGRGKSYKEIGEIFDRSGWWASTKVRSILRSLRKEMEG